MLKVVLSLISLSLIFSLPGCQDVQPPPDQQGAANPSPAEEAPMAQAVTRVGEAGAQSQPEATPAAQAEMTPAPEGQPAQKQPEAKPRKMNAGLRMARDKEAAKALRPKLGMEGAGFGPFALQVNVDDDGNYTGVTLYNTKVNDKMVDFVAGLDDHTEYVMVQNTDITDEQVARFAKLKFLKRLEISGAPISGACLVILKDFDKLEKLNLSSNPYMSLNQLPELPALTELNLLSSKGITDASIPKLATLKGLKSLSLYDSGITEAGAAKLQELLPDCEVSH